MRGAFLDYSLPLVFETGSLPELRLGTETQISKLCSYRHATTASFLIFKCGFWGPALRSSSMYRRHLPD